MKNTYSYIFLIIISIVSMSLPTTLSAFNDATDAFKQEALGSSRITTDDFARATQGLDYAPKKKEPPKEPTDIDFPDVDLPDLDIDPPSFDGFGTFLKVLLWVVAGAIVLFIIARVFLFARFTENKKVEIEDQEELINHIEDNLHKVDVEGFLNKALNAGDYRLATRLYFLTIMKELSLKNMIRWKKDKTNGRYLTEMYQYKAFYNPFREITRIFEYAWYSERSFGQTDFESVRGQFKDLLTKIKKAKPAPASI